MMIKKIKPWLFTILLLSTVVAFALEVAIEEIDKATTSITFTNYTGQITDNESTEQIRAIGASLAQLANFDNQIYTINNKYSIIEVTNDQTDGLYSAAILSIDPSARVDHIRNVRQITAGYLQSKYSYSSQEADTLAYFLSFYNAIYRGNINYLNTIYKPDVFNFMNESNAGIATNYLDWPGQTRFIIPLTELSTITIAELDGAVTSAARQGSDGLAINQRENLVEMKEDVIRQNQQLIVQTQQLLANSSQLLNQVASQAEQDRQTAEQAAKRAEEAKAKADQALREAQRVADLDTPDAITKQQQAQQAQQEAEQRQNEAAALQQQSELSSRDNQQQQQAANQQKSNIEAKTEENRRLEAQLANEQKQLEQDKIAQDVRTNPAKAAEEISAARSQLEGKSPFVGDKFFYMDVSSRFQGGHYKNKMLSINPAEGLILSSSNNNICSKDFIAYGKGVVVVTATNANHTSGHSLSMLNLENLEPMATSQKDIDIYWSSFIYLDGGKIYAITVGQDKQFYLARFNDRLEIEGQSIAHVDGDTSISINKDKIYVNLNGRKQIVVLNKNDLTTVSEIKLP